MDLRKNPLKNLIPAKGPQPDRPRSGDEHQCPFCSYRNDEPRQVRSHVIKSHNGFA